ncbi:MAG: preprotein translocase subunit YajC [Longimicrobiales bacterium]|nr:preprotein translocase subunit YajC [Longimicrobiales bacterium]
MIPTTGLLQTGGGGGNLTVFLIQIGAFIAIFYFLLIRPQRKEQQRHQTMLKALVKGDEVITNGGIIGKIVRAEEDRLTVRTGQIEVIVDRGRIARRLGDKGKEE